MLGEGTEEVTGLFGCCVWEVDGLMVDDVLLPFDKAYIVWLSPLHDHASSSCWMKVLEGEMEEVRYVPKSTGKGE